MQLFLTDYISPVLAGTHRTTLTKESYREPIIRMKRPADHIHIVVRIEGIKPTYLPSQHLEFPQPVAVVRCSHCVTVIE